MIELAAIVSEALEAAGIVATLSGGGAVSAYTEKRWALRVGPSNSLLLWRAPSAGE